MERGRHERDPGKKRDVEGIIRHLFDQGVLRAMVTMVLEQSNSTNARHFGAVVLNKFKGRRVHHTEVAAELATLDRWQLEMVAHSILSAATLTKAVFDAIEEANRRAARNYGLPRSPEEQESDRIWAGFTGSSRRNEWWNRRSDLQGPSLNTGLDCSVCVDNSTFFWRGGSKIAVARRSP